jgi:NADH-quinone oxidoreductase subunit N
MFSLAGIPPLAGFWAKWYVFLAAIDAGLFALAVIGVVTSVVGAYYYLRIIKIMWFDESVGGFLPMAGELRLVLGTSGAFMLFYVLFGGAVSSMAATAARTFF